MPKAGRPVTMLTGRQMVDQQFNTVRIVMSNRLNPNKSWVN
jgi:hypothetical protein